MTQKKHIKLPKKQNKKKQKNKISNKTLRFMDVCDNVSNVCCVLGVCVCVLLSLYVFRQKQSKVQMASHQRKKKLVTNKKIKIKKNKKHKTILNLMQPF